MGPPSPEGPSSPADDSSSKAKGKKDKKRGKVQKETNQEKKKAKKNYQLSTHQSLVENDEGEDDENMRSEEDDEEFEDETRAERRKRLDASKLKVSACPFYKDKEHCPCIFFNGCCVCMETDDETCPKITEACASHAQRICKFSKHYLHLCKHCSDFSDEVRQGVKFEGGMVVCRFINRYKHCRCCLNQWGCCFCHKTFPENQYCTGPATRFCALSPDHQHLCKFCHDYISETNKRKKIAKEGRHFINTYNIYKQQDEHIRRRINFLKKHLD